MNIKGLSLDIKLNDPLVVFTNDALSGGVLEYFENRRQKNNLAKGLLISHSDPVNYSISNIELSCLCYELKAHAKESFDALTSFIINVVVEENGIIEDYLVFDAVTRAEDESSFDMSSMINEGIDTKSLFTTARLEGLAMLSSVVLANKNNSFWEYSEYIDKLLYLIKEYGSGSCITFLDKFLYPLKYVDINHFGSHWDFDHILFLDTLIEVGKQNEEFRRMPLEWQIEILKSTISPADDGYNSMLDWDKEVPVI